MFLLSKFLSHKSVLGVDIGTTSIKIAKLKSGKKPELEDYAILESYRHFERANETIQTSNLKMLDKTTTELLQQAIKNLDTKNTEVVASVQAFSAFVTLLELPMMSQEETANAMNFQARQYIPLPISEVTIDWVKVGEKTDEFGKTIQQVLLVSVPNEIIKKYENIFQAVGLNLVALEVEGLSLARALTLDLSEPVLIADIGSRSTSILIAQSGFLKFMSQTDFAGSSLTQNLASGLNLTPIEAEALKRERGLTVTGDSQLSTLMPPILDVILNEVRQVKDNFEKTYKEKVEKVILSGGGSNLAGIDNYFADKLGLSVVKANPFSAIDYPEELEPLVSELSPILAIAIGLAMRNI
jgi:type IV pilus assembly protein PilM